jgi:hypothetical protein
LLRILGTTTLLVVTTDFLIPDFDQLDSVGGFVKKTSGGVFVLFAVTLSVTLPLLGSPVAQATMASPAESTSTIPVTTTPAMEDETVYPGPSSTLPDEDFLVLFPSDLPATGVAVIRLPLRLLFVGFVVLTLIGLAIRFSVSPNRSSRERTES